MKAQITLEQGGAIAMDNEEGKLPGASLEENLKKAATELLLLHLLAEKPCYIGELTEAIRLRSHDALSVVFPYGAIYRLQRAGYIRETEKRNAPAGRRRQYFAATESGKARLALLLETYRRFTAGVEAVLEEKAGEEL